MSSTESDSAPLSGMQSRSTPPTPSKFNKNAAVGSSSSSSSSSTTSSSNLLLLFLLLLVLLLLFLLVSLPLLLPHQVNAWLVLISVLRSKE